MEKIKIDSDGDLTLVVGQGEEKREYLVDSRAISRASPVFKRMLNGPFVEGRPVDPSLPWAVSLPEDDPQAACTILKIAHSSVEDIPTDALRLHDFYKILVFSEKYDMAVILRPWVRIWGPKTFSGLEMKKEQSWDPHALFYMIGILWELGALNSLTGFTRELMAKCEMNNLGALTIKYDGDDGNITQFTLSNPDLPLIPPGLLGRVSGYSEHSHFAVCSVPFNANSADVWT